MSIPFLTRILAKTGLPHLPELLAERLSASDLTTLLLEVFERRTRRLKPAQLLHAYRHNRLVQPAAVDAVAFAAWTLRWLEAARRAGFDPLRLSPVAPLGSCSAVAACSQHKVLSALRGVEVVADATNLLALESSRLRQEAHFPSEALHLAAVHQHIRMQEIKVPGFTPHFTILALTSAGRNTGHVNFELEILLRHLDFYQTILPTIVPGLAPSIRLNFLGPNETLKPAVLALLEKERPQWSVTVTELAAESQPYYQDLQFKITILLPDGSPSDIADGGLVSWTQQLTGNAKERFLISGIGIEYLFKMWIG